MTEPVTIAPGIQRLRAAEPLASDRDRVRTPTSSARTDLAVIDPGPRPRASRRDPCSAATGRRVAAIIVTHAHLDHSALAPRLAAATGARRCWPSAARTTASAPRMAALAHGVGGSGEGLDHAFTPDRRLADGDRLTGPDWELEVLHTPGHLGGHLCLALGRHALHRRSCHGLGHQHRLAARRRHGRLHGLARPVGGARLDPRCSPATAIRSTDPPAPDRRTGHPPPSARSPGDPAALATGPATAGPLAARIYTDVAARPCCPPQPATSSRILLIWQPETVFPPTCSVAVDALSHLS